ncbi:MAG: restriction endonuclease subunit S [Burkholderiales bacterium]
MRDIQPDQPMRWNEVIRTELESLRGVDWLRDGDVLFVAKGTRYFAACLADVPPNTISSPHMYVLRVKAPDRLIPEFLAWQINQRPAQKYFTQTALGTNQLSIRRAVLESMTLAVPILEKQRKVLALAQLAGAERFAMEKLIKNRQQQLDAVAREMLLKN